MIASQEQHACTMHTSQETKGESCTSDSILIFYDKKIVEKNWIFEFLLETYPISKKNRPKQSSESEVMIILKSTKFQCFSENGRMVFKISSKLYLDLLHYNKRKWISMDISMVHLLHHICAYF
jgi:hypothetical protein